MSDHDEHRETPAEWLARYIATTPNIAELARRAEVARARRGGGIMAFAVLVRRHNRQRRRG